MSSASPPPRPVDRGILRRLLPYLSPYRWQLAAAGVCLLLGTPARLFHPLVWKYIVDTVIVERRPELLAPALAVMLAVHVFGGVLQAAQTYLLGYVAQHFACDLREDVYQRIQSHSMRFFGQQRAGDLMSRVMGDVDTLQEVSIRGFVDLIANALQFVVVTAVLLSLDWRVGGATLLPMAVVALLVWVFNNRIKGLYRRIRDRLGDVSAKLQENLTGILVIKAFARERVEFERFSAVNRGYRAEAMGGVIAQSAYFSTVFTVGFLSSFVMVGVGAWYVLAGTFTVGGLVAYRGYWFSLFQPVNSLAQVNELLQRGLAAAARVFEVVDEPQEITDPADGHELSEPAGRLALEAVEFGYRADEPVLRGVDLVVPPGGSLGVVGPSGSGKSTLISLFLRLYDPTAGRVTIDGVDLREVTQESLRRHLAVVTQEPFLFNDTIARNILFGRLEATTDEVVAAAKAANAHTFIEELTDGYETVVGERGVRLSGGQKQRICIARAFLANPRVLLLDEATAAVEPESEAIIQAAVERLAAGRTAVLVSHRMSMVRDCDQIVVIRHGRIEECGPHEALMAAGGWYARMYQLQTAGLDLALPEDQPLERRNG